MTIKYQTFTEPYYHLIIDDFLTPRYAKQVLEEAIELEPFYEQATVFSETGHDDDCDACKKDSAHSRTTQRDNKVIFLDKLYKNKRGSSVILSALQESVLDDHNGLRPYLVDQPGLLPIIDHINSTESILSRYGMCDFYGWHRDPLPEKEEERILTVIYYFNKEPATFTGGELLLGRPDNYKTIVPKHNRLVMFESRTFHSVNTVELVGDFDQGRFSINYWLGFNGSNQFKGVRI